MGFPHDENPSRIKIYEETIQKLNPGEFYQYLGVPVGNKNDQNPTELLNNVLRATKAISNSGLQQHQKIKAIQTVIFPKLIFAFRTREISRTTLQVPYTESTKIRGNLSNKLRIILREILCLPPQAETAYLYTDTADGGAGLRDLFDEYNLQQIVQGFKLLNCKDPEVAMVMRKSLYLASEVRVGNPLLKRIEALHWINGFQEPLNNGKAAKSWWMRIRRAFQRFSTEHNTHFSLEEDGGYFNLRITDAAGITTVANRDNVHNITEVLHSAIHKGYQVKWKNSKLSNLLCEQLAARAWTNKLIYSGLIGPLGWNFIHKARSNSLSINAHPKNALSTLRTCRRCHGPNETMTHVLQSCKLNMTLVNDRHNACLNLIFNAVKNDRLIVAMNNTIQFIKDDSETSRQRIDLYIEDVYKKSIILADLKCPIDMPATMNGADPRNIAKYAELKTKVQKAKPGNTVTLLTIVVGSLGCVPEETRKVLKKIGISNSRLKGLQEDLSITNIRHSARIWHMHRSGELVNPEQGFERSTFYKTEYSLSAMENQ